LDLSSTVSAIEGVEETKYKLVHANNPLYKKREYSRSAVEVNKQATREGLEDYAPKSAQDSRIMLEKKAIKEV